MDEIDYSKPVEGQKPLPMEQHWRKHTLSTIDESGETKLDYRLINIMLITVIAVTVVLFKDYLKNNQMNK